MLTADSIDFAAINAAARRRNASKILGNDEKPGKINNTELLAKSGLNIIHLNRVAAGGRSMTVAYDNGRNIVRIATAVTHPGDTFTRKVGTKTAIERFQFGRVVSLPVPREWQGQVREYLLTLFSMV